MKLPTLRRAGCASEFLEFFEDCHPLLEHTPADTLAEFQSFNLACHVVANGVGVAGAVMLSAETVAATSAPALGSDSGVELLLCFELTCPAVEVAALSPGQVVESGCDEDGRVEAPCRLSCQEGYEASAVTEGVCTARWIHEEEVAVAEYVGQSVTCSPEKNADGTMAESYCQMEKVEVILDCCELQAAGAGDGSSESSADSSSSCGTDQPPSTCSVECAERWNPLVEDCGAYLAEYQVLSESCEEQAAGFLGSAPSTVTVSGLTEHGEGNGVYSIALTTIGGKPLWIKPPSSPGRQTYNLYAVNEPHDGWVLGPDHTTYIAIIESYEGLPPWQLHNWQEAIDSEGGTSTVRVQLSPGYSDNDCHEALQLLTPALTETCCKALMTGDDEGTESRRTFEDHLEARSAPEQCHYDCASEWYEYSVDCADFLGRTRPFLADFSSTCAETHASMSIYNVYGHLTNNGHEDHFFNAEQGLVYR